MKLLEDYVKQVEDFIFDEMFPLFFRASARWILPDEVLELPPTVIR